MVASPIAATTNPPTTSKVARVSRERSIRRVYVRVSSGPRGGGLRMVSSTLFSRHEYV
jgi:hypothetical protein